MSRHISDESITAKKVFPSCSGKVCHPTEHGALIAARKIAGKEPGVAFKPYYCSICQGWHVGSVGRVKDDTEKKSR